MYQWASLEYRKCFSGKLDRPEKLSQDMSYSDWLRAVAEIGDTNALPTEGVGQVLRRESQFALAFHATRQYIGMYSILLTRK